MVGQRLGGVESSMRSFLSIAVLIALAGLSVGNAPIASACDAPTGHEVWTSGIGSAYTLSESQLHVANWHNVGYYDWIEALDAWVLVHSYFDPAVSQEPFTPDEEWYPVTAFAQSVGVDPGGPGNQTQGLGGDGRLAELEPPTEYLNCDPAPAVTLRQVVVRGTAIPRSRAPLRVGLSLIGSGASGASRVRTRAQATPLVIGFQDRACDSRMEDNDACNIVRGYYAQGLSPGNLANVPTGQTFIFRFNDGKESEWITHNSTACVMPVATCRESPGG